MEDRTKLVVGQLRRWVLLGTEATYRVQSWNEERVRVEVVDAPGLVSGRQYRLDRRTVSAMGVVDERDCAD